MYRTTQILQTEQNHEVDLSILRAICYHSARLYNVGLYNIRQYYFNTQKYLSYNQNYHDSKSNENYLLLLSDAGQSILRIADRDMRSFFRLLSCKKSGRYSAPVKMPHYKGKEELMVCPIQGRSCRIQHKEGKDGTINIGLTKEFRELYHIDQRCFTLTIPKNLRDVEEFQEVRIVPKYGGKQFAIEFVYSDTKVIKQAEGNGYMSIDLGVSNLAACTIFSNGSARQFLIDGRRLKNINYYYNKKVACLKSAYSQNKSITSENTKRMIRLMNGRKHRINEYFDIATKRLVNECIENNVTTLVIGYNKEQKQGINIGSVNNQNMCHIPFYRLREKLKNECTRHGINYISQEESYTSKVSAIDEDFIPNYGDDNIPVFSGKRVHRGLYKSKENLVLNADINGSINILRKYFKERKENWLFQDSVRALVNVPCQRIYPLLKPLNL